VARILDDGLDQERRLRQLVEIPHHPYSVSAALQFGELVAVLGDRAADAVCGGGGTGPEQDLSVGGSDGGQTGRDRARAGDGESFVQGISWCEVRPGPSHGPRAPSRVRDCSVERSDPYRSPPSRPRPSASVLLLGGPDEHLVDGHAP
jgi:hypothetical protein